MMCPPSGTRPVQFRWRNLISPIIVIHNLQRILEMLGAERQWSSKWACQHCHDEEKKADERSHQACHQNVRPLTLHINEKAHDRHNDSTAYRAKPHHPRNAVARLKEASDSIPWV